MLKHIHKLFSKDIFIDLGSANTLIYVKGQGIVIDEPSVVAVQDNDDQTKTIRAIGIEAKQILGRTPKHLSVIHPIKDGVIADFNLTEKMLRYFFNKVFQKKFLHSSLRVLICIPYNATQFERNAIRELALNAGAREVFLIDETIVAAMGAGMPVCDATGSMVLDIGGGTTEIGILSLNGVVSSNSIYIGGHRFDQAIMNYVRHHYKTLIGEATAERVKQEIGLAFPTKEWREIKVWGRNLANGIIYSLTLNSNDILKALKELLMNIVNEIKKVLEKIQPELSADIAEKGIILTGGSALLKNLDCLLMEEMGLPVTIAENPLKSVVYGGGCALEMIDEYGVDIFNLRAN
jgi:rod shape-determining protein MreB